VLQTALPLTGMSTATRTALFVTFLTIAAGPAVAQPEETWHSLAAPSAAFEMAGVSLQDDRAQLMLRLIRRIHSLPDGVNATVDPARRQLSVVLEDTNALLDAVGRLPNAEVTLARTHARPARDAVKAVLEAAGLRLREQDERLFAELDGSDDQVRRREHLARVGIDATRMVDRLNAGEAVRVSPPVIEVPLPLAPGVWADAVFQHAVPPRTLFSAIIGDRNASLLYYGLCALTPETRALLSKHPDLLRWLYRERPGTLAAYGGSLRVANGRVDVPGGEAARPLWEALIGAPVTMPVDFLKQVLGRDEGRLAYLYESIDALDGPRQNFALGLASDGADGRVERLRALYRAFAGIEAEWSQWSVPFARPMYDAGTLLQVARVGPDGTLAAPASRGLWRMAFDTTDLPDEPAREVRDVAERGALDAASLAELVALAPARHRRQRFEAFAFGQRVFGGATAAHQGDMLVAIRAFARYPAVMLILERLGVTSPQVYASIARHALAIERVDDPSRQIPLQAQFQGALATLDRLVRTGHLDRDAAAQLLVALSATMPVGSGGYGGRVAAWIDDRLLPAIRRGDTGFSGGAEHDLVTAFADPDADGVGRFEWEGLAYDVSIATSERRRIEAIREKQGGNSLDAVLAFSRELAAFDKPAFTVERVRPAAASLKSRAATLTPAKAWPGLNGDDAPNINRLVDRAVRDLSKIKKPKDATRATRIATPLIAAADYLLGETLVALAYAPVLGDPESVLGGEADVSHKHDFAVATAVIEEARTRGPWMRPRFTASGVVGAALGLDLVLAPRVLRRLAGDRVPELPRLNENDREAFATSVVLMNPRRLSDAGLHHAAAGVREGRRRVVEAGSDVARLEALAAAARMSAARRQLLRWAAKHDLAKVPSLFSIAELLEIGAPGEDDARRHALGVAEEPLTGCYCVRFPSAGPWEIFSGRPATGQLATRIPDLTLRLTELLDELKAPAVLLPWVLSLATHDFIHEVPALYADDWAAAVDYARAVSRERVEDYIASLTATGPLRPAASHQR
jgi:hypothetical protein